MTANSSKTRVVFFPIEIIRVRDRDARLFRLRLGHDHESVGLGIRERPEQDRVDHAEDGGVRADAEREGENGDEGEARRFAQLAKSEAKIIYHIVRQFSFISECDHGIDSGGAKSWDDAGEKCRQAKKRDDEEIGNKISRSDAVEHRA